ncbi:MAG: hypothetical protein IJL70_08645 [Treponema sp.]|nr:hypothetical protein [Treponema sp.]
MFSFIKAFVISGIVLFLVSPVSCRLSEKGITLYCVEDYECPKIKAFGVTGAETASITFSKEVNLHNCSVSPGVLVVSSELSCALEDEKLWVYDISFDRKCTAGTDYKFIGIVKDSLGNSLTFSLPFKGFNENVPDLEITEIHPKYSAAKRKTGTVYKTEYVEFLVKSDGNLAGVELRSANDGMDKVYKFPAVEVRRGEIVLVHLRTKSEVAVSELGNELNLSTEYYSSDNARDLWAENDSARLGDDIDVICLVNSFTEEIIDGICYAKSDFTEWKDDFMAEMAKKLKELDLWNAETVSESICIDGITSSKSIIKTGIGKTAADWTVSESGRETPGKIDFQIIME